MVRSRRKVFLFYIYSQNGDLSGSDDSIITCPICRENVFSSDWDKHEEICKQRKSNIF